MRTIFNFLGPLTNPAGATRQLIGVSDPGYLDTIAAALARLGARRALVVSSHDGLDEMSTSGTTRVVEVDGGELRSYEVAPEDVGLARARRSTTWPAGPPGDNAAVARRDPRRGARRAARPGGAQRRRGDLRRRAGRDRSRPACARPRPRVDSGAAAAALERLVALTGELAPAR